MAEVLALATSASFAARRAALEEYFDRTAHQAWLDLTSDTKVSGVRATVRAGREQMRATLLGWLPSDMRGARLLDAGCGTGALAVEAAARGADVVAIDIAAGLVEAARERTPAGLSIDWRIGDFADPALGQFDFIVAMDSLIHYRRDDLVCTVSRFVRRADAVAFTFAPRTTLLSIMHAAGKLFPRGNRSPAIEPVAERWLEAALASAVPGLAFTGSTRLSCGFYTSHAMMVRAG